MINMNITKEYIAGFVQADGCFSISTIKRKDKINIRPVFTIVQNIEYKELILEIQKQLNGAGHWYINKKDNTIRYQVTKLKELHEIILPFFDKYQLRSNKYISYLKFKYIVNKLIDRNNTNQSKTIQILDLLSIAYTMNPLNKWGNKIRYLNLEEQNKVINNINIINIEEFKINNNNNITNEYISGLFDGDGNISVYFSKYKTNQIRIRLTYSIVQDIYNESLLYEIKNYFNNVGNIYRIGERYSRYDVKNILDIKNEILTKIDINKTLIKGNKLLNTIKLINILIDDKDRNRFIIDLKNNENNRLKLEEILRYSYKIIKNQKNKTYEEYKQDMLNKYLVKDIV